MNDHTAENDAPDPKCAHGVWLISEPGRSNWCATCYEAGLTELVHDWRHYGSSAATRERCRICGEERPRVIPPESTRGGAA